MRLAKEPDEFVKLLQVLAAIHFPSMLHPCLLGCYIYRLRLNLKFSGNKTYYVNVKVCITKLYLDSEQSRYNQVVYNLNTIYHGVLVFFLLVIGLIEHHIWFQLFTDNKTAQFNLLAIKSLFEYFL